MTISPRSLIGLSAATTLAVGALALALALAVPVTGTHFTTDADNHLLLADDGRVVTQLVAGETIIPADASLAIEEPDMFPTYADYNGFMSKQSQLAHALAKGTLAVQTTDGEKIALQTHARTIAELPLMFWMQLLFGVGGMLTGALVLAGRPQQHAAQLYALTGLGYLIFAPAAAVYSTRELVLDGELFRMLSVANHFGALLFTGSLTALLWTYPIRLAKFPMVACIYAVTFATFAADTAQVTATLDQYQLSVLAIYALSFVFAGVQWWKTRAAPAERAALRWFLLAIYLATGLFAGVIIIPAAMGIAPPASQGVMFGAFLIMYWGLALGIVRYRLFQLEQWWRAIWWWFLGGLAVVVLDFTLISSLALSDALALSIAVAIVGWVYFPLRQWLWHRIGATRERALAQWLPDVLPILIETQATSSNEEAIRGRWPGALQAVFRPLAVESLPGTLSAADIRDDGLALAVPDVRSDRQHLLLRHAANGERLFTRNDLETLAALRELFDLALDRLRERDTGARIERERIRRDVHDDLGAKLLTLLHTTPDTGRPLVREALEDLRALLRALENDQVSMQDALDTWEAEARKRCETANVALEWRANGIDDGRVLRAREHANLTRMLREAVSNALRHASPAKVVIDILLHDNQLAIVVRNDGSVKSLDSWSPGRGRQIMQSRVNELAGSVVWQVDENGCELSVQVPLG